MFSGEFNPKQHEVRRGVCIHCKQVFPGEGYVYTKEQFLLSFVPRNYNVCKGEK